MPPLTAPEFPFARFASQLWDSGRVDVPDLTGTDGTAFSRGETEEAEEMLHHYERQYRKQLPGETPEWNAPAAMWGLEMLYRACSFLLHREATAETMQTLLNRPCPAKLSASVCYSVDLSFRFLPDLHGMVSDVARHDPLCDILEKWGTAWPLSSVGLADRKPIPLVIDPEAKPQTPSETGDPETDDSDEIGWDLSGFWEHQTLRRVYLDRILTTKDLRRLMDPKVVDAIREDLGNYHELAPEISRKLQEQAGIIPASPGSVDPVTETTLS